MKQIIFKNGCSFEIVRYYLDKFVIRIKPLNGSFLHEDNEEFITENLSNKDTNFENWINNNF